jgi:hypothetical protein|tara:strand:+ start:278 stop:475 length:198 start_codon:yes stop_codon:yes gene_type:complete
MKNEPTAWLSKERDVITFDNLFPEMTPLYMRNDVLEEVAREFDAMRIAFGDTADSFATYVRDMKQ